MLGQRRTVVIGAVLMAIGHFMMAIEQLFLFALLALILGNGASSRTSRRRSAGSTRPAIRAATAPIRSSMSASISARSWRRSSAARSAKSVGWHYGFAAAGVGMVIGLCIYLYALPLLPTDEMQRREPHEGDKRASRSTATSGAR